MHTTHHSRTSLALASLLALTLAVGCGSNALDSLEASVEDAPDVQNLKNPQLKELASGAARVGILWFTLRFEEPGTTLVTQEVKTTGSFPDSFRLELAASPPDVVSDEYLRGSLVVLNNQAEFGTVVRNPGTAESDMPFLSEAERAEFGIVSMPPVFTLHVPEGPDTYIDAIIDNDEVLDPGYHMAVYEGPETLQYREALNCERAGTGNCPPRPTFTNRRRLTEEDKLSIVVGGPEDLLNVLRVDPPEPTPEPTVADAL